MKCVITLLCFVALSYADFGPQHIPRQTAEKWHLENYSDNYVPMKKEGAIAENALDLAARERHLASLAETVSKTGDWRDAMWSDERYPAWKQYGGQNRWHSQPAPLNPDGTVAETPEVRALRIRHLAALAAAEARALAAPKWLPRGHPYIWSAPADYYNPGGKAWRPHYG